MKKVILVSTCTNNKTVSVSENKKYETVVLLFTTKRFLHGVVSMVWRRRASCQYLMLEVTGERRSKPSINCLPNLQYLPNSGFFLRVVDSSQQIWKCPLIPPPFPRVPMVFTNSSGNGWSPKERAQHWWKESTRPNLPTFLAPFPI